MKKVIRGPRRIVPLLLVVLAPAIASAQGLYAPDPDQPAQAQQSQNLGAPASQTSTQDQQNSTPPAASNQSNHQQPGQTKEEKDRQDQKDQKETKDQKGKQTNRMAYVVPNFAAVSAYKQLPPLSVKGKFSLAFEDSFDYSAFVWTGIVAAQDYGLDSYPELGRGFTAYGRYYWRGFLDQVSGTYFTEAIVPAITHEDPRYYTMENGGFGRRLAYALERVVVTKTDSGGESFNWSEVGGNALEAALSTAYYPEQERTAAKTAENFGTQIESAALNNIAKEFWPDFRRKVLRRK